ncbi:MAG: signal peptidase I [Actinomycetota bacterium]|jgi:signal peptidase I|nr:signal peptidase I [Actinomycetota bacterium]
MTEMNDIPHDEGFSPESLDDTLGQTAGEFPDQDSTLDESVATEAYDDHVEKRPSFLRWLGETLLLVAVAFVLAQGIKTFVVQPYIIPTGSMVPTIEIGDRVIAEKVSYRFGDPEPGDVVVIDDPAGQHPQLIKRVIAVGGQTIDIDDGKVFIDGVVLDEPYLVGVTTEVGTVIMPLTIPEGEIFVMGDNRPNSGDARYFGALPVSTVKARAVATYWPLDRLGGL